MSTCPSCGASNPASARQCGKCKARLSSDPDRSSTGWVAGDVIESRYELTEQLGEGGMGVVWAGRDLHRGADVAIKMVKSPLVTPEMLRRFFREARAATAVKHPNVVQIIEVFVVDGDDLPVMVMERLRGQSLCRHLERERRLSIPATARILLPVASALGTAHAMGIIHRDIKPENVFLTADGGVKVLDFGIAKLTAVAGDAAQTTGVNVTSTGAVLGTPCYMSPEQAFAEKDVDHRTDIWALGLILYECVAGVLPTLADNIGQVFKIILTNAIRPLSEVAPETPPDISELVRRMLAPQRNDRPSLAEISETLGKYADIDVPSFGTPRPPADFEPRTIAPTQHVIKQETADPLVATREAISNGALSTGRARAVAPRRLATLGSIAGVAAVGLGAVVWSLNARSPSAVGVAPEPTPTLPAAPSIAASASEHRGPAPPSPVAGASAEAAGAATAKDAASGPVPPPPASAAVSASASAAEAKLQHLAPTSRTPPKPSSSAPAVPSAAPTMKVQRW